MKIAILLAAMAALPGARGADHQLKASPATVAWGYYWSAAKPVLTIRSGDTVEIQTLTTCSPTSLANAGVKPEDIEPELKAIYAEVKDKGPGGHILTGPIYIEGAEPGDALEVRIQKIQLAIAVCLPTASARSAASCPRRLRRAAAPRSSRSIWSATSPGSPTISRSRCGRSSAAWASRRAESIGRINSGPPGDHAGNLDNKDLVAGTTLFIPVHVQGALFEVGDGHAGQGNGEVDITAMETSLVGHLPVHRPQGPASERTARRDADPLDRHGPRPRSRPGHRSTPSATPSISW